MKTGRLLRDRLRQVALSGIVLLSFCVFAATAAVEQTFAVLQVGTTTYHNVTVTTKTKSYVFILHSNGMTNLKVAELTPELRAQLGYEIPPTEPARTKGAGDWAKQTISSIQVPAISQFRQRVAGWEAPSQAVAARIRQLSPKLLLASGAILALLYLLNSYCCLRICQKCGCEPGLLIWVPVLQLFPLLKAAEMSPWWFLAFLAPGINWLAQIVWCFKITLARGKGLGVALLFVFPPTAPFAFLYLAFSDANSRRKETSRRIEIMTLETA
ncbi:MAG TPA: DUF5684 domain-containing protein [Verrucomicrobiae bacterium]|nr:DUF5684 domain-containing protein [Verrucomicrobiae bacterium]